MKPSRMLEYAGTVLLMLLALGVLGSDRRAGDITRLESAEQSYNLGIELVAREDFATAKEKFRESAALLEAELSRADSAGMHFNRANALLQAGDVGDAIASYRSAQLRAPADTRIAANLAEARSKVSRSLGAPEPTALEQACQLWAALSEQTRLILVVVLSFTALLVSELRLRAVSLTLVVLAALSAGTVAADIARRGSANIGVISESTLLRKGNGDGFEQVVAEPLPEGTECRVRESRPGWIEVEIAGGTRGWVKDAAVTRVK